MSLLDEDKLNDDQESNFDSFNKEDDISGEAQDETDTDSSEFMDEEDTHQNFDDVSEIFEETASDGFVDSAGDVSEEQMGQEPMSYESSEVDSNFSEPQADDVAIEDDVDNSEPEVLSDLESTEPPIDPPIDSVPDTAPPRKPSTEEIVAIKAASEVAMLMGVGGVGAGVGLVTGKIATKVAQKRVNAKAEKEYRMRKKPEPEQVQESTLGEAEMSRNLFIYHSSAYGLGRFSFSD